MSNPEKKVTLTCPNCGKDFERYKSNRGWRKNHEPAYKQPNKFTYCSEKCRKEYCYKEMACQFCGKKRLVKLSDLKDRSKTYCDATCFQAEKRDGYVMNTELEFEICNCLLLEGWTYAMVEACYKVSRAQANRIRKKWVHLYD